MSRAFIDLIVYSAVVVLLFALWDFAVEQWRYFLARRMAELLEAERQHHVADLAEARRQHRDAQLWLMETHRGELDRAVAEAMTSRAPHPITRAS